MSQLEAFIREHRNELDVFTPPAGAWSGIEAGIKNPTFIKSSLSWLKYAGFSTSAIAVLVYLSMQSSEQKPAASNDVQSADSSTTAITAPVPVAAELTITPEINSHPLPSSSPVQAKKKSAEQAETAAPAIESVSPTPSATPAAIPIPVLPVQQTAFMFVHDSLNADTIFSGIKHLEIVCSSMDINISSVPGDKILFSANEIEGKEKSGSSRTKIKIEKTDSVLRITEEKNPERGKISCPKNGCTVLNFRVPAATSLNIQNAYGDVRVSGMQGKLCDIDVRSGDVRLDKMNTELKLNLGYGDLLASDLSGPISAKVSSGDVSISGLKGNSGIQTSYGDQEYSDITGTVKAQCSSGDIEITNMNGNAEIISSYGDIVLENYRGSPSLKTNSGDIKGKNVELTGNMEASTSYGDIKFDLVNDLNALSFDLDSQHGDITIEKGGKTYENVKRVELKNGNIFIKAHTDSGDQSYK